MVAPLDLTKFKTTATPATPAAPTSGKPLDLNTFKIPSSEPLAPGMPSPANIEAAKKTSVGKFISETATEAGKQFGDTKQNLESRGQEFLKANEKNDLPGQVGALGQAAIEATGGAARIAFSPLTTLLGHVVEGASNIPEVQKFAMKDSVGNVLKHANDLALPLAKVSENHPQAGRDVQNIIDTFSLMAGPKAVKAGVKPVINGAKALAPEKTLYQFVKDKVVDAAAKRVPKHVDQLEKTYQELAGSTSKTKKVLAKGEKATALKNNAGTTGQEPSRVLAENGIVPKQKGTRLDTIEQAQKFRDDTEILHETNRSAIKEVQSSVPRSNLDELEKQAVKAVRTEKNVDAGVADQLEAHVKEAFAGYKKEYGTDIPLTKVDDIKVARWKPVKFDSTKPLTGDANYAIAKTMQKEIEGKATSVGHEDVAQLNRHIGDRLEAAKFLESLDSKVLRHGHLGKHFIRTIGAMVGAHHGPIGTIAGALGGDAVANILINTSVAGPVKRMVLRQLQVKNPEAYDKAIEFMARQGHLREITPKLPPGNPANPQINQGRVIKVFHPTESKSADYIGRDTVVGRYTPPNAAPKGNPKPIIYNEQYTAPKDLPVIDMGPGAKPAKSDLPTLRYSDKNDLKAPNVAPGVEKAKSAPSVQPTPQIPSKKGGSVTRYTEKPGNIEQIIEKQGGWQAGDKEKFDKALLHGDAKTVHDMMPRVPKEYQERFKSDISKILNRGSSKAPAFAAVTGVQKDKDGNVTFNPLQAGLGFLGVKGFQKIHPQDMGVMRDFTDFINNKKYAATLSEKDIAQIKKDAQNIADHYKFSAAQKGDKALSNQFGTVLDKLGFDKKLVKNAQVRDPRGRFDVEKKFSVGAPIYRGENPSNKGGIHWTLDKEEAKKFAGPKGTVTTGKVPAGFVSDKDPEIQKIVQKAAARALTPEQLYTMLRNHGYSAITTTDSMTGKQVLLKFD